MEKKYLISTKTSTCLTKAILCSQGIEIYWLTWKDVHQIVSQKGGLKTVWSGMCYIQLFSSINNLNIILAVSEWVRVSQLWQLCDAIDCSLPGSSVHGIPQARTLEWLDTSSSRGSSQPRGQTTVSCFAGRFFTVWATSSLWVRWQFLVHRAPKGGKVPIWPSTSHTPPPQENRWKRQWGREELTCWSISAVSMADAAQTLFTFLLSGSP